jgi:methylornithine synthase
MMISPGVVPDEILRRFSDSSVDWYALYQETHNPALYKNLRLGQGFEERIEKRAVARRSGMLIEDGILLGVGETIRDRADAIMTMKGSGVHQARVMSLVPQRQTPLADRVEPARISEYLCIAVMRLVMPDRLIPASLDVDGIRGLRMRLDAGANVVTSIIPPNSNLAGVSQSTLDIEQGLRTVPEVKKVLYGMGLESADAVDYRDWVTAQKEKIAEEECHDDYWYYRGKASGIGSRLSRSSGRI